MAKIITKMDEAVQDFKNSAYGPASLVIAVIALGCFAFALFK